MVDRQSGLYIFHKVRRPDGTVENEGTSIRYTAITLIGLYRAKARGLNIPSALCDPMRALARRLESITDLGDLGLVLWADSTGERRYLPQITARIRTILPSAAHTSMHWSWLLTGLCYAEPHLRGTDDDVSDLLRQAYGVVLGTFEERTGLFRYSTSKPLAFFAEQAYGTYAMAAYYERCRDFRALRVAEQCAGAICRRQGPLGQWFWRYDARTGHVLEPYPVYSIHQDGMGPLALLKVRSVGGTDYSANIFKGLAWIFGQNELGRSMVDWEHNLIWRSIRPRGRLKHFSKVNLAFGLLKQPGTDLLYRSFPVFEVDYETRPYHFGWLLYAFSDLGASPTVLEPCA